MKHRISPEMIHLLNHPLRREILRLLNRMSTPLSPTMMNPFFSRAYDVPDLSYHVRVLVKGDLAKYVDERPSPKSGAMEKFVLSQVSGHGTVCEILTDTAKDDEAVRA